MIEIIESLCVLLAIAGDIITFIMLLNAGFKLPRLVFLWIFIVTIIPSLLTLSLHLFITASVIFNIIPHSNSVFKGLYNLSLFLGAIETVLNIVGVYLMINYILKKEAIKE